MDKKNALNAVSPSDIHDRVTYACDNKGISARQLCDELGYSPSVIWNMKNYYPSIQVIIDISRHLDVSINWLLTGESIDSIQDDDLYMLIETEDKKVVTKYVGLSKEDKKVVSTVVNALAKKSQ